MELTMNYEQAHSWLHALHRSITTSKLQSHVKIACLRPPTSEISSCCTRLCQCLVLSQRWGSQWLSDFGWSIGCNSTLVHFLNYFTVYWLWRGCKHWDGKGGVKTRWGSALWWHTDQSSYEERVHYNDRPLSRRRQPPPPTFLTG